MHLLSVHFNRQHHSFLVSYRPLFMRDMACGGPYFSKLLLNAIYFGASKFSSRLEVRSNPKDPSSAGWAYRQRSKDLLVPALDKSNITTVQALLILTNSLFAMGQEKQTAWLYAGMAVRMIIDLGMHVEDSSIFKTHRLSFDEVEIRRRVFWAGYGKPEAKRSLEIDLTRSGSCRQNPVPLPRPSSDPASGNMQSPINVFRSV